MGIFFLFKSHRMKTVILILILSVGLTIALPVDSVIESQGPTIPNTEETDLTRKGRQCIGCSGNHSPVDAHHISFGPSGGSGGSGSGSQPNYGQKQPYFRPQPHYGQVKHYH